MQVKGSWNLSSSFLRITETRQYHAGDAKMHELPELWNICQGGLHIVSETGPRGKSLLLSLELGGESYIITLSSDMEL